MVKNPYPKHKIKENIKSPFLYPILSIKTPPAKGSITFGIAYPV
jgi:hypothetical protein